MNNELILTEEQLRQPQAELFDLLATAKSQGQTVGLNQLETIVKTRPYDALIGCYRGTRRIDRDRCASPLARHNLRMRNLSRYSEPHYDDYNFCKLKTCKSRTVFLPYAAPSTGAFERISP
jgi:hypothetical protein